MFRKLKIRTKCAAAVRIEICATGPLERMSANPGSPFEMNAPFAELDSIVNGFIFGVQPELSSELDAPPPPPPAPLPSRKRKMSAVEMRWGGDATRPIATWDASEVPSCVTPWDPRPVLLGSTRAILAPQDSPGRPIGH